MQETIGGRQEVIGEPVRYAFVGMPVQHRWTCVPTTAPYCMSVHNCYVDSQSQLDDDQELLIDEHGCTRNVHLVEAPRHNQTSLVVTAPSHVFKYADKPQVSYRKSASRSAPATAAIENAISCQRCLGPLPLQHHTDRAARRQMRARLQVSHP